MQTKTLPKRDQIAEEHKWRLSDIYQSNQDWTEELNELKSLLPQLQAFRGELNSANQLLACLQLTDEIGKKLAKIMAYALMGKDQNNADDSFQEMADKAMSTSVLASSSAAFIEPEILNLPSEDVYLWILQTAGLQIYSHYLEDIIRLKPHTLPAEQEELLAQASEMAQAPSNIFRMFNNADLKFPCVKDETGQEVELTHGRYTHLMESQNRQVRQATFTAMYDTYTNWRNTLATTYTAAVKKTLFYAKVHKYDSALEAALDGDNVPLAVYHNLIETVHDHIPVFNRYMQLRKRLLKVDELHMYDIYVPMVDNVEMTVNYTKAMDMVKVGLAPLGQQYISDLSKGFEQGWIDWFENKGKTSGAYSWGAYGVHPYVMMNYQDNIDNMFTLAHEMGHAMHSYYSDKNQEYINAGYTIFVAEVASTLNEALVMADLLQKTKPIREKMYLLNHNLEQFRGTVFRQTMFAEYEMLVHEKIGQGEPMTADSLSKLYYQLNQTYYGEGVVVDEDIAMEWARIPHFYRPFYVYKYATGFSAAVALAEQILTEGDVAVQRYLTFLGSGGSDYPINLLKKAGVDMTTPDPIVQAMAVFTAQLEEMEELARRM